MYRDAEEIEREKVLLVCERGSTGTYDFHLWHFTQQNSL